MLWICLYLPRLPLDALPETSDAPRLISAAIGNQQRVVVACARSQALDVQSGQTLAAAQARLPQLQARLRDPQAEAESLRALAGWAYQFNDRIHIHHERRNISWRSPQAAILIETSACLRYHGGLQSLMRRIETLARPMLYEIRLGAAPSSEGALLMARLKHGAVALDQKNLRQRLARLPLDLLNLPRGMTEKLWRAGVRCVAQLLALPREQLARRYGAAPVGYLRRLLGEEAEAHDYYQPPLGYRRLFELGSPCSNTEQLQRPIHSMLHELQGLLGSRDLAAQSLQFELQHRDRPATVLALQLLEASADATHIWGLMRERMHRLQLAAPVEALKLELLQHCPATALQNDLFEHAQRVKEPWQQVLERLQARLGRERICALQQAPDYRPEAASRYLGFTDLQPPTDSFQYPARPLWLLPQPEALPQPPTCLSGPERIEAGWWDQRPVARDYYIATHASGARLWVFRRQQQWYLHGYWA